MGFVAPSGLYIIRYADTKAHSTCPPSVETFMRGPVGGNCLGGMACLYDIYQEEVCELQFFQRAGSKQEAQKLRPRAEVCLRGEHGWHAGSPGLHPQLL